MFRFDFFLILSKDSSSPLDSWLVRELCKRGKKFFYIRTFMDRALEEEQRVNITIIKEKDEKGKNTREMEIFMRGVREDCVKELRISNFQDVPIYLVSSWYPERFEFAELLLAMSNQFSAIQREVFLFSTKMYTEEILKGKKEILQKRIFYAALGSGVAGAIPIPGSGTLADVPLIMKEIGFFKEQFQLDCHTLDINCENNKKLGGLLDLIDSVGTKSYVLKIVSETVASQVVAETSKMFSWATIGVTLAFAGATSFGSTYYILTRELDKIVDISNEILNLKIEEMMK